MIAVLLSAAWIATRWNQTLFIMIVRSPLATCFRFARTLTHALLIQIYTIPNIISAVAFLTIPNNKSNAAVLLIMYVLTSFSMPSFIRLTRP